MEDYFISWNDGSLRHLWGSITVEDYFISWNALLWIIASSLGKHNCGRLLHLLECIVVDHCVIFGEA